MYLEYNLLMKEEHGSFNIVLCNMLLVLKFWNWIPPSIKKNSRINYRKVMKCLLKTFCSLKMTMLNFTALLSFFLPCLSYLIVKFNSITLQFCEFSSYYMWSFFSIATCFFLCLMCVYVYYFHQLASFASLTRSCAGLKPVTLSWEITMR